MCPAVTVVVVAAMAVFNPLHTGLVIHIFIQHRSFQYLSTMLLLLFLERQKSSREGRTSSLSGFSFQWKEAYQGVCGCVADRPLDKCHMLWTDKCYEAYKAVRENREAIIDGGEGLQLDEGSLTIKGIFNRLQEGKGEKLHRIWGQNIQEASATHVWKKFSGRNSIGKEENCRRWVECNKVGF